MNSNSAASPQSVDELEARWKEAQSRYAERRRTRLLGEEMIALACVPVWTESLAQRVLSKGSVSVPETFADLVAEGLVQQLKSPLREEQTSQLIRYVMPDTLRAQVLTLNAAGEKRQTRPLWRAVQSIAQSLCDVRHEEGDPEETLQWAALVAPASDGQQLADRIDADVRNAHSTADIYRIVEVARYLEPLFRTTQESSLDVSLLRAGRRLELLRRHDDDRMHLRNFISRREQMAALEALVGPDDEQWALHLVGAGGVGKTMLLRHISSDYSAGRFAVARVDFDYLNPDYPRLAPGLLLWAFGEDLRAYATDGRFDSFMDDANAVLRKLHEELRANVNAGPGSIVDNPAFQVALKYYVEALRSLNFRVLLVLDTCEELARIRSDGSVPDSVRDTFLILKTLHQAIPSLRVILSGRRPLASAGSGWRCPSAAELPVRKMLRLHEIRGFTHGETRDYLQSAGTSARLWSAIISRCPDVGRIVDAVWEDPALAPSAEPRCNPYDLKLYAEWAAEDPPPDEQTVASSTTAQYVEFRVMRRLGHPELERLVPVIAMLGHIDDHALRNLTDLDEGRFERLQLTLRQQEWISVRLTAAVEDREPRHVYSVDPALRTRLLAYAATHSTEWAGLRERTCRYLVHTSLTEDLSRLDWTDFDATINALDLCNRPVQLARWWQLLAGRLQKRDPQWRVDLLRFLCLPDEPAGPAVAGVKNPIKPRQRVRPAILATYAAALLESGRLAPENSDLWNEVFATAGQYPLRRASARLRLQGAAGRLITSDNMPSLERVEELAAVVVKTPSGDVDADSIVATVKAVSAVVETLEMSELAGEAVPPELADALARVADRLDDLVATAAAQPAARPAHRAKQPQMGPTLEEPAIWMRCLRARTSCRVGDLKTATDAFADALRRARGWNDSQVAAPAAELRDSLYIRVLLEYARAATPILTTPDAVLEEIVRAFPGSSLSPSSLGRPVGHIPLDLERLAALRLRLVASVGPPGHLDELETALRIEPRVGSTAAQRSVPPLCCVAAEELAAGGMLREALAGLLSLLHDSGRNDEEIRREIERAYLRVVLRFRLFERGEGRVESLLRSTRHADRELIGVLRALGAEVGQQTRIQQPADMHTRWRALRAPDDPESEVELRNSKAALAAIHGPDAELDQVECALLMRESPASPLRSHDGAPPTNTEESLARELRRWALLDPGDGKSLLSAVGSRLGPRRAAERALEEATILLLRLPANSARLARQARQWFSQCGDHIGSFRAVLLAASASGPSALDEFPTDPPRLGSDGTPPAAIPFSLLTTLPVDQAFDLMIEARTFDGDWMPLLCRYLLVHAAATGNSSRLHELQSRLFTDVPASSHWELRLWFPAAAPTAAALPTISPIRKAWHAIDPRALGGIVIVGAPAAWWHVPQSIAGWVQGVLSDRESLGMLTGVLGSLVTLSSFWLWRQWFVPRWLRLTLRAFAATMLVTIAGQIEAISMMTESLRPVDLATPFYAYLIWRLWRYSQVGWAVRKPIRVNASVADIGGTQTPANGSQTVRISFPVLKPYLLPRSMKGFAGKPVECVAEGAFVDRPYQDFARRLRPDLAPLFTRMRGLLGLRWARFELRTDTLEGHAWPMEAVGFLNAGSKAGSVRSVPFRFVRRITVTALPPTKISDETAPPIRLRGAAVGVLPSGIRVDALAKRWQRRGFTAQSGNGSRILQLLGTVREDSAGLRLRLIEKVRTTNTAIGGVPMSPEELIETYPKAQLCLLQGADSDFAYTGRGDADRRRAALARVFAARLCAAGVPLVITLPPMEDPGQMLKITDILAGYASKRSPGADGAFLQVLDDIRHVLCADSAAAFELRPSDLLNPRAVAASLAGGNAKVAPLAGQFSESGRRDLERWSDLPDEALVGLLLNELNPILRRARLENLVAVRGATWRRLASVVGAVGDRQKHNRKILAAAFKGSIGDRRAGARADAWENAADVCGFRADFGVAPTQENRP